MNILRNLKIRAKLVIAFTGIAVLGGLIAFIGGQVSTTRITEDAIPSLQTVEAVKLNARIIQAEILEFVSTGEDEALDQFDETSRALTSQLAAFPALADDPGEAQAYSDFAASVQDMLLLAAAIAQEHAASHESLEALEEIESQAEQLLARVDGVIANELARNLAAENLDEIAEDALPSKGFVAQFGASLNRMLLETVQFVAVGETESLEELSESKESMAAALQALLPVLEADEPGEAEIRQALLEIEPEVIAASDAVVESHQKVLDLLEQLEIAERQLEEHVEIIDSFIQEDVAAGTSEVNTGTTISSLAAVVLAVGLGLVATSALVRPLNALVDSANKLGEGDLSVQAHIRSGDEMGDLAQSFNKMAARLRQTLTGLENTTRDLILTAEVGRSVSEVKELSTLLSDAVELIRERFGLYYVQIYLTDPAGRNLVLSAGSGAEGQRLLRRGHRLPIDMASINGSAVVQRQAVIVEDTASSTIHRPNPALPETRSEMAVPLLVGDQVVGVLDIQSSQAGALDKSDLPAYETLAGQLAIAIQNAALFTEVETTRAAFEKQAARLSAEGWQDFLNAIDIPERLGYAYDREQVVPLSEPLPKSPAENINITPIQILGQQVGTMRLEGEKAWSQDDARLIASVSGQLAQQIENLRLLSRSERYRQEAQEAVRRLTREGWRALQEQSVWEFAYDGKEVKRLVDSDNGDIQAETPGLSFDIQVGEEPVGQFSVSGRDKLTEQDQALVAEINRQIAAHIERLRLQNQTNSALAETENQAERLAALNRLSDALTQAENIDDVYRVSASLLPEIVDAERISMTRPAASEGDAMLEVFALVGETGVVPTGSMVPVEGTAVGKAMLAQRDVSIPDLLDSEFGESSSLAEAGLRSTLAVPLVVGGQSIGTVNFGSQKQNAYTDRMRDIANQAVALMASSIENRNLFSQTESALERTDILFTISQKLNEADTDDEILQAFIPPLIRAGAVSTNLVHLETDDAGDPTWAEIVAIWRREGESPVPVGTRFYLPEMPFSKLWISDPDHPVFVSDVRTDERLDDVARMAMEQGGSRAITIIPLTQAGERVGLVIINWHEPHLFTQEEKEIFTALIGLVSPTVRSRRIYEQTQFQANQEALINRISQQIQSTTTVDDALQVAIRELGRALDAEWTSIELG